MGWVSGPFATPFADQYVGDESAEMANSLSGADTLDGGGNNTSASGASQDDAPEYEGLLSVYAEGGFTNIIASSFPQSDHHQFLIAHTSGLETVAIEPWGSFFESHLDEPGITGDRLNVTLTPLYGFLGEPYRIIVRTGYERTGGDAFWPRVTDDVFFDTQPLDRQLRALIDDGGENDVALNFDQQICEFILNTISTLYTDDFAKGINLEALRSAAQIQHNSMDVTTGSSLRPQAEAFLDRLIDILANYDQPQITVTIDGVAYEVASFSQIPAAIWSVDHQSRIAIFRVEAEQFSITSDGAAQTAAVDAPHVEISIQTEHETDDLPPVVGDDAANALNGSTGDDTVLGLDGDDLLDGGAGNDLLVGGQGNDRLAGGSGNDTYFDPQASDTIIELAGGGFDTIESDASFSLLAYAEVEALTLTGAVPAFGRGNARNNVLRGNDGSNQLEGLGGDDVLIGNVGNDNLMGGDGNDRLDGGIGRDTLTGGAGNDIYVNPTGDNVVEAAGGGSDSVESKQTFSLAPLAEVENLALIGTAAINGTGNAHANFVAGNGVANSLIGGAGADTLDGGAGADTLSGGTGNDVYLNPLSTEVKEITGQGFDRVLSDASFSLATLGNVERLELTGAIPGFLRGNAFANQLVGNAGSNTMTGFDGNDAIFGAGGRDTLIGGLGRDQLAPGLERDTLKFDVVAESTGATRDFVSEFVFSSGASAYETLDFHVTPTALRATVAIGALSEASFEANLAAAIGAGQMSAGEAVLFDPDGGDLDLAGQKYLIVDANGVAGYQAGADYVLQFTSSYGTLTLANFV